MATEGVFVTRYPGALGEGTHIAETPPTAAPEQGSGEQDHQRVELLRLALSYPRAVYGWGWAREVTANAQTAERRHPSVTLADVRERLLRDPAVRQEYDELRPQFDVAVQALRLRLEAGMTQAQLAEKMGTKQSVISRFERGESSPSTRFLQRLARALGTELRVSLGRLTSVPEAPTAVGEDLIRATRGMFGKHGDKPLTQELLEEHRREKELEEAKYARVFGEAARRSRKTRKGSTA
jgi:transcriptional regulator with XRE-family HTH domain